MIAMTAGEMIRTARWSVTSLALGAGALAIGTADCGSDGIVVPLDAGSDTPGDRLIAGDAVVSEDGGDTLDAPMFTCDASAGDSGLVSDWPGWRRLTEVDPCCVADIPLDVAALVPTLEWISCADGSANCLEMKVAPLGSAPPYISQTDVSRGASGAPVHILVGHQIDSRPSFEVDIYDFATRAPLAAWRSRPDHETNCGVFDTNISVGIATVFARVFSTKDLKLGFGDPGAMMRSQSFTRVGGAELQLVQEVASSDTVFAFDLQPAESVNECETPYS